MQDIFAFYPDSGITKEDLNAMFKNYGKTEGEGMTMDEFTEFMRASYVDDSVMQFWLLNMLVRVVANVVFLWYLYIEIRLDSNRSNDYFKKKIESHY